MVLMANSATSICAGFFVVVVMLLVYGRCGFLECVNPQCTRSIWGGVNLLGFAGAECSIWRLLSKGGSDTCPQLALPFVRHSSDMCRCAQHKRLSGILERNASCAVHTDNRSKKVCSVAMSIPSDCRCHPRNMKASNQGGSDTCPQLALPFVRHSSDMCRCVHHKMLSGILERNASCAEHTDNRSEKVYSVAMSIPSDCRCYPRTMKASNQGGTDTCPQIVLPFVRHSSDMCRCAQHKMLSGILERNASCAEHTDNRSKKVCSVAMSIRATVGVTRALRTTDCRMLHADYFSAF